LLSNIHSNKTEDYIIELIELMISNNNLSHSVKLKAARILNTNTLPLSKYFTKYNYMIAKIIHWLSLNDIDWIGYKKTQEYTKLTLLTSGDDLDYEDLNILSHISNVISDDELLGDIRTSLLEYWYDFVHEFISESNEFSEYYDEQESYLIKSKAKDMVKDMLSESSIVFNESEIDDIIDNIDVQSIIESNIENYSDWDGQEYTQHGGYQDNGFDGVDDIFSRE
uniref:hypothetical protein n=1 Tax=Enterobacter asburiae TaxID=61645 RepID=UPI00159EE0C6